MTYYRVNNNLTGDERCVSLPANQTPEQVQKMFGLDPKTSTIEKLTYDEFCAEVEKVFVDGELSDLSEIKDFQLLDKDGKPYKSVEELLTEAIDNLTDTIEYVLSESGDPNIPRWLEEVEETLRVALVRVQQEDL